MNENIHLMSETPVQDPQQERVRQPRRERPAKQTSRETQKIEAGETFRYSGPEITEKLGLASAEARVIVAYTEPDADERGGEYVIHIKTEDGPGFLLAKSGHEIAQHLELRRRLRAAKETFLGSARRLTKAINSAHEQDVIPALEAAADSIIARAASEEDFDQAMFTKIREAIDIQTSAQRALAHVERLIDRVVPKAKISDADRDDLKLVLDTSAKAYISEGVHRILTGQSQETPYAIAKELILEEVDRWEQTQERKEQEAQKSVLEGRLKQLDGILSEGKTKLNKLEEKLTGITDKSARALLLRVINKVDAEQLGFAHEWAHTYKALHPETDEAAILAIGEELAGESMLVGVTFAGANTKEKVLSRIESVKTLQTATEPIEKPMGIEMLADEDIATGNALVQVFDRDPAAAKKMIAAAEQPETVEAMRSSRPYVRIEAGYQSLPISGRALALEQTKAFVGQHEHSTDPVTAAHVRAWDQWLKDTQNSEAEAFAEQDEAFFETGERLDTQNTLDRIGVELHIGNGADVRALFENFEQYRTALRDSNEPRDHEIANLTLQEFLELPDQDPAPRGFFAGMRARFARMFSPAGPTPRQRMHEQMIDAMRRNSIVDSEDAARISQRAQGLRQKQRDQFEKGVRGGKPRF